MDPLFAGRVLFVRWDCNNFGLHRSRCSKFQNAQFNLLDKSKTL